MGVGERRGGPEEGVLEYGYAYYRNHILYRESNIPPMEFIKDNHHFISYGVNIEVFLPSFDCILSSSFPC